MPAVFSTFDRPRKLDARPDRIDLRDRPYLPKLVCLPPQFPDDDFLANHLPKFRKLALDQGEDGACTGFGLASVVNYLLFREREVVGRKTPVASASAAMIYRLARMYDEWPGEDYEGSSCRGAMKGWHKHGICSWDCWGHQPGKTVRPKTAWREEAAQLPLGAYYRIDKGSVADLQSAIHEVGAIYVSATVHAGWKLDVTEKALPLIAGPQPQQEGIHAFAIVGYTPEGFIVQNSWGADWGLSGFAILTYDDWIENGVDAWVAVLGAPMRSAAAPVAHSPTQLVRQTAGAAEPKSLMVSALRRVNLTDAYLRSIMLENNGLAISRLVDQHDGRSALRHVALEQPRKWLAAREAKHLAVFVQSGLGGEDHGLATVRSLAPVFENNEIFPIFVVWRHEALEALTGMIAQHSEERAAFMPAKATAREREALTAKADYAVEATCRQILAKAFWKEIKANARRATTRDGAAVFLAGHLARLHKEGVKIHLIGHSAGCLFLGGLLGLLAKKRVPVDSCHLLAPAIPLAFANAQFAAPMQAAKPILAAERFFVDLLSDERERADTVAHHAGVLYHRSLLYLISRALEDTHKTPLLGLQAAWNEDAVGQDVFHSDFADDLKTWRAFAGMSGGKIGRLTVHDQPELRVSAERTMPCRHGNLDRAVDVISVMLGRMLRLKPSELPFAATDLRDA